MGSKEATAKVSPKRFIDRNDRAAIISSVSGFNSRDHDHVPNWLFYLFSLLLISFVLVLLYFSTAILEAPGQKVSFLYLVQYLFFSFVVLTGYTVFLIRRVKGSLNATEFISLSLSQAISGLSGSYCLINNEGKIFFYNQGFVDRCMSGNDVEDKKYHELLSHEIFNESDISAVKGAIDSSSESQLKVKGGTVKILPLQRPKGVFVLNIVNS